MTTFDPWDHPSLIAAALAGIAKPVNPGDFIRPDGSYDVTPENIGDRDHVQAVRDHIDRLRDATPTPWTGVTHEGSEL